MTLMTKVMFSLFSSGAQNGSGGCAAARLHPTIELSDAPQLQNLPGLTYLGAEVYGILEEQPAGAVRRVAQTNNKQQSNKQATKHTDKRTKTSMLT